MTPRTWYSIRCHGPLDHVGSSLVGYCPICDKEELEAELPKDGLLNDVEVVLDVR